MQVEQIAVRLRRRTPWEALDLGPVLLRTWAGPAYRAWLASYWTVALLLLAGLWTHQGVALFILWWLKPAFDRILLFSFSRSLFGQPATLRDLRQALPELVKHSGLLSGLSLRRFSLARSFLLPVWQLERQHGAAARARFKVLGRRSRGNAVWLTVICSNLSIVLFFSLLLLLEMMTPRGLGEGLSLADWFRDDLPPGREFLASLLVLLAETVIEPLYVASGFALYLNRRSELEGWDIELAFRRLAARVLPTAQTAAGLLLAVALAGSLALGPAPAQAAEPATPPVVSPAKQTINSVLADPVFGQKTSTTEWRWRQSPPEPAAAEPGDWLQHLLRFVEFLSQVMTGLTWIVGLLLATALIYLIVAYRDRWSGRERTRPSPPDTLFGFDVRPDSLPADIVAAARAALAAGRVEAALSLLYRGALLALLQQTRIEFRPGDTEGNCRRRIAGHLDAAASRYFAELVDAWRATAYAHQPPAGPVLDDLCRNWAEHFGRPAAGKPA